MSDMTRRSFLGAAAGTAAALGVAAPALASEAASQQEAGPAPEAEGETLQADVVIAGCGAAGLLAATEVARAGKSVIVVDKGESVGMANGAIAGGPFVVNSRNQQELGVPDFSEEAFLHIMDWSHWSINAPVVRACIDISGQTVDNFTDDFGIPTFARPDNYGAGYASVRCGFGTPEQGISGADRFQPLVGWATERGAQFIFGCAMESLVMEDGVCRGLNVVYSDGTKAQVLAEKTLVATGGFLGSDELMMEHFGTKTISLGQTLSDGTGIQSVIDAGGVYGTQWGIAGNEFGGSNENQGFVFSVFGSAAFKTCIYGPLLVNHQGRRFSNEGEYANFPLAIGGAISMVGGSFYGIVDQAYVDGLATTDAWTLDGEDSEGWPTGEKTVKGNVLQDVQASFDQAVADGWAYKADTVEELAEAIGAPALTEAVASYNELCAAGEDTQFHKPASFLNAIEEGPFYAVEYRPSAWVTIGGVRTNDRLQAIDREGNAIEGLYVAGADNGSTISAPYCSYEGTSLMTAYNSGRLAGMWMCEDIDAAQA